MPEAGRGRSCSCGSSSSKWDLSVVHSETETDFAQGAGSEGRCGGAGGVRTSPELPRCRQGPGVLEKRIWRNRGRSRVIFAQDLCPRKGCELVTNGLLMLVVTGAVCWHQGDDVLTGALSRQCSPHGAAFPHRMELTC